MKTFVEKNRLELLDSLPKESYCAEIGVFRGDYSAEIVVRCNPMHLYLVDVFEGVMYSGDRNGENIIAINMGEEMYRVRNRFDFARVQVVKGISWEWLSRLPMSALDWCYIDTSHGYHETQRELAGALSAVRDGGYICGHDYAVDFSGVIRAVDEFCERFCFDYEIWRQDKLPSFKIWKHSR